MDARMGGTRHAPPDSMKKSNEPTTTTQCIELRNRHRLKTTTCSRSVHRCLSPYDALLANGGFYSMYVPSDPFPSMGIALSDGLTRASLGKILFDFSELAQLLASWVMFMAANIIHAR